jgi:hypothetical protein
MLSLKFLFYCRRVTWQVTVHDNAFATLDVVNVDEIRYRYVARGTATLLLMKRKKKTLHSVAMLSANVANVTYNNQFSILNPILHLFLLQTFGQLFHEFQKLSSLHVWSQNFGNHKSLVQRVSGSYRPIIERSIPQAFGNSPRDSKVHAP